FQFRDKQRSCQMLQSSYAVALLKRRYERIYDGLP
ncbi:MAG: hypothetical protein ACI9CP_001793, partial [Cryomorphaceae bacterium]